MPRAGVVHTADNALPLAAGSDWLDKLVVKAMFESPRRPCTGKGLSTAWGWIEDKA